MLSSQRQHFDSLFEAEPDPWGYRTRFSERRRHALEPGCADGVLTSQLAHRCTALLASDASPAAVALAVRATAQPTPTPTPACQSSWITEQLRWADDGIAAVAGVVTVDSFAEHPRIVAERFHARYTALLPDESLDHPHVHGANLGVRLDAYLNAGGWHRLDLSEDHDLWNRLRADDLVIRSPSSLRVTTSGRALSRCPGGFADGLCADRIAREVTA